MRRASRLRAEQLLPLACIGAALILLASQLMTIFDLNGGPGQTFQRIGALHQHSYAVLVLAIFALLAVAIAVLNGSKPAAAAVAVAGVAALLLFLLLDLPDVGKVGTVNDPRESFFDARADPALGFWLELIGALILSVCGAAMATLDRDQLRALPGRFGWKRQGSTQGADAPVRRAVAPLRAARSRRTRPEPPGESSAARGDVEQPRQERSGEPPRGAEVSPAKLDGAAGERRKRARAAKRAP